MLDAVRVMQESAACAAALSLPHWVYAYTWVRPRAFASFSGVDLDRQSPAVAAKQLCTLAVGLKIVQALFFLRWWLVVVYGVESDADGDVLNAFRVAASKPLLQMALAAVLVFVGNSLNFAVYDSLGMVGVYYGDRFGANVPWVTGWPFNFMPHPQYVGASCNVLGATVALYPTEGERGHQAAAYMVGMAIYWVMLYVATTVWEDQARGYPIKSETPAANGNGATAADQVVKGGAAKTGPAAAAGARRRTRRAD